MFSKIITAVLILVLPANLISAVSIDKNQQKQILYKTDRFIVKYKGETNKEIETGHAAKKVKQLKQNKKNGKKISVIRTGKKMSVEEIIKELDIKKDEIEYIQPDYQLTLLSNDPYLSYQWGIYNKEEIKTTKYDETVSEKVYEEIAYRIDANVKPAWEETKGEGITVAVIDTGVDITHEDLKENIWENQNEIKGNSVDDDGNGYVDDINGWNFYEDTNEVYNEKSIANEWHGTHIAGIIAGEKENGKGISGISPEAKIMVLKTFEEGTAYTSDIIEAINYAEENGAKIINCSFGTEEENPALEETVKNSEMLFVTAAGNRNTDIDNTPVYPASYNFENVITAASMNKKGMLSSFSNYGKNTVDAAAPGEEILSTIPGNKYGNSSGTSMAAAYVTGQAALLLSKNTTDTSKQTRQKILTTSDRLSTVQETVYRGNKINCENSVYQLNINTSEIINIPRETTVRQAVYQEVYRQVGTYRLFYIDNPLIDEALENIREQSDELYELSKEIKLIREIIIRLKEQKEQGIEINTEKIKEHSEILQILLKEVFAINENLKNKKEEKEQTIERNIKKIKEHSLTLQMIIRELEALNQIIVVKDKITEIDITENKEINVIFTAENIKSSARKIKYTVTYNPDHIKAMDLCGITEEEETTLTQIPETGIEITEYDPMAGKIQFTVKKTIEEGKMWSGIINCIKFKRKENTSATQTEIKTEISN